MSKRRVIKSRRVPPTRTKRSGSPTRKTRSMGRKPRDPDLTKKGKKPSQRRSSPPLSTPSSGDRSATPRRVSPRAPYHKGRKLSEERKRRAASPFPRKQRSQTPMRRRQQKPVTGLRLSPLRAQYDYPQSSPPPQSPSPPKRPSSSQGSLRLSPVSPALLSASPASSVNLPGMVYEDNDVSGGA